MTSYRIPMSVLAIALMVGTNSISNAQSVILPAPRILTTMPMGGQAGTTFPVTITSESVDTKAELIFSDPRITSVAQLKADGTPELNKYQVTIAADAPPGVYEARVLTRLGVSSSRAFSVGVLPEVTREKPNTTLQTALQIEPNSICNAFTTAKAIDHYTFNSTKGSRVTVECVATGIDSKLKPVLIVADEKGRDLSVDRRGGFIDFTVPADGTYVVKVHGLTFQGGGESFYRLALQTLPEGIAAARQPATEPVNAISIPASSASAVAIKEAEPNNRSKDAQKVSLPFDVAGSFFPAADVDTYEFDAKKGEVWWIDVISERTKLPTNPFVNIQQVVKKGDVENAVDVLELNDLPSPVKLSSNGYSYDGSPYDVGTADAVGKFEVKEDGTYRLQVRDLFGGTRNDPRCTYRLMVRKAEPDFALAAWALHMTLRNGDRAALSKPIALRNGATMIFEVVAVRKDGFNGEIEVSVENLPEGVTAQGFKIPANKSSGTLIITAASGAKSAHSIAKIVAKSTIDGKPAVRDCRLASMAWPVRDSNQEIPNPRLIADVAVSVSGDEATPLTIVPANPEVLVVAENSKVKIPLKLTWRGEYSGAVTLKPTGSGFEKVKTINVPLNSETLDVELDLADLKLPVGDHVFALYGGAVTKYRYNVAAVDAATEELRVATEELTKVTAASQMATEAAKAATGDDKAALDEQAKVAAEAQKKAEAAKTGIEARLKAATSAAAPSDIVDIVVTEPIRLQVTAAEKK
ncbi:serine protease [Planctomicrobium sp. SH527]|uniref:serine protease n=1 Tax=Planctomicrobium sp. SH527 TaxID=3448123 RepID=UPI003F5BA79F